MKMLMANFHVAAKAEAECGRLIISIFASDSFVHQTKHQMLICYVLCEMASLIFIIVCLNARSRENETGLILGCN